MFEFLQDVLLGEQEEVILNREPVPKHQGEDSAEAMERLRVRGASGTPADFLAAQRKVDADDSVLIEEYVPGIEATVAVIEGFRGQELYVLPVIEIRNKEEIVPATFSSKIKEELAVFAQKAHRARGLRHYSRSDFIISPRRGIYILEINSLPGLTEQSLVPKALRAVGSDTHELVDHLIGLALKN